MKLWQLSALWVVFYAWPAAAQVWDTSGNGSLNGTYYFREVFYVVGDDAGDLQQAISVYGNITFNGRGSYSVAAAAMDSNAGASQTFSSSGTYSVSSSGYGFLSNPLSSSATDSVYILVSNGIVIGSSTETQSGFNELFVAAPVGSTPATNGTLQGTYTVNYINFSGAPSSDYDATFQLNANGQGGIGTVNFTAYVGGTTSAVNISEPGVTYSFQNGAAIVKFPTNLSNAVIGTNEYLYISPDGNFVFGGSPVGFDMFVGVRTGSGTPSFGGLYYQAGLDEDTSTLGNAGYATLDTFYGSLNASSNGSIVGHERIFSVFNSSAYGYSYGDTYTLNSGGSYSDSASSTQYTIGQSGIRVGLGTGPFLGISVAVPAPTFSGSGVFLNPTGVVNAASFAPFTAGISRGGFISLFGTDLAPGTKIASTLPFPPSLNGVQVLINNTPAPVYFVSTNQISAIVPYGTTASIAQIQVSNNGSLSNAITAFVNATTPGIFTLTSGGLGYGAVLHADYSAVTTSNPGQIGETVQVFLTGLGDVFPTIPDGSAGPLSTLNNTTNTISADIGGVSATVAFAGLAPGFAGLYQVNVTIPAGVSAGDNTLDIAGPDSYAAEALIPIGAAALSSEPSQAMGTRAARAKAMRKSNQTRLIIRPSK